jgi:putative acetyltransferase
MKVRAARRADIPALAGIAERSYRSGFADILEEDVLASRTAGWFAQRFAEEIQRIRVAVEARRLLGFTLVTGPHIDMLFVDPEAARQGAGAALLRDAEAQGAATLECFADNAPARAFYEHHGWRVTEDYEREFLGRMRWFVMYGKSPAHDASGPLTEASRL